MSHLVVGTLYSLGEVRLLEMFIWALTLKHLNNCFIPYSILLISDIPRGELP